MPGSVVSGRKLRCAARVALLAAAASGCREAPAPAPAPANVGGGSALRASSDPAFAEAERQRAEAVEKALNPKGLPTYSGPVGGVRGVVKVSGDAAPLIPEMAGKIPDNCPRAIEFERKLFREGVGRSLGDVLVTVTEYDGLVRPRSDVVNVEAKGCAFDAKVLALVYGQRIDVFNRDPIAYMPRLLGVSSYTLRVAMPGGAPVPVFAPKPGRYLLVDEAHDYVRSEVYVLNYPTFDVTGLDGAFEITGIPAGEAKVTAFSPALGKLGEQRVQIQSGVVKELTFELAFSQAEYEAALRERPPTPAKP
jgi:hypothetical protein